MTKPKRTTIRKTVSVLPSLCEDIDIAKKSMGFSTDTQFFVYLFRWWQRSPDAVKDFINH